MKKCHAMKFLVVVIVMVVVFCLGVQLGELKSEVRGAHKCQGKMMDWNYKVVKPLDMDEKTPVNPAEETPAPTLKQ